MAEPVPRFVRVCGRKGRSVVLRADTETELAAEIAKLRWRIYGQQRVATHQCGVCEKLDAWRPGWIWYGSIRDFENGEAIVKMCSEACRAEAVRRGLVPRNAPTLDG